MKKKRKNIVLIIVVVIGILGVLFFKTNLFKDPNLKYSKEYIIGQDNIKGEVDVNYFESKNKDFEIGANNYGYAVFKNPDKAFNRVKKDYQKGINLIQKEYNLSSFSKASYEIYGTYGWQVRTGTEEEQEQARFISEFVDIYENSYRKK